MKKKGVIFSEILIAVSLIVLIVMFFTHTEFRLPLGIAIFACALTGIVLLEQTRNGRK